MHLLRTQAKSLDEIDAAVDLDQTPAEVVFLSFTDSDLAIIADAWLAGMPGLRVASLAQLKHPYSVDLYIEKVAAKARFVLVRLLGGLDYWRYGVDELAAGARRHGFALAIVPGDHREDARLDAASTLPETDLRRLWAYFQEGGPSNAAQCLNFVAARLGAREAFGEPRSVPAFGLYAAAERPGAAGVARALIVFYRSVYLASDTAPILALAEAVAAQGLAVTAAYVTSLKDPAATEGLALHLADTRPDIVLNTTAFAARQEARGVLDAADAPVLQAILAGWSEALWQGSARGLGAADLAMNVVLPEIDGRIITCAISFKAEAERSAALEFTRLLHRPQASRVEHVARLAAFWVRLRRTPRAERRIACILSDYPAKGGRTGYAVGLDTPASLLTVADRLRREGYAIGDLPDAPALMEILCHGEGEAALSLADYERMLDALPRDFVERLRTAWGDPAEDEAVRAGAFHFRSVWSNHLIVAVQPDRGHRDRRKAEYHDGDLLPRHAYVAFYLWLREMERVHAIVHVGTHGTLEWLPGNAVALTQDCAPEVVLGPVPVLYPFIVNNPGEAAQAKRRIAAVTIGHLAPPLREAGSHGTAAEIEGLLDEYAQAEGLDPRRAKILADLILERAQATGLIEDSGIGAVGDRRELLVRLDAWICDLKEMRIGDGLHVFGRTPPAASQSAHVEALAAAGSSEREALSAAIEACAEAEMAGLVAGLDGRFVEPGPAGAPSRGRLDVLPTGRNLFTIDPRAVPTRTAWEIGQRMANEVLARYAQDHGDWPKRIVLDLWGSATMRTGGDDLAQALALMGARPLWDDASTRVRGFEILPLAKLGRPRVDVTLRISGLFRDVFPAQIALFDEAARSIAALDEPLAENPLVGAREAHRIFGAAPGHYGTGLARQIASGSFDEQADLAATYLAATSHAYGKAEPVASVEFRRSVAEADAFVHVQDMGEQDVLGADAFAEHEGGFAAAAASLGNAPALYHGDTSRPEKAVVRTLAQEIARVLRGRAVNPLWLEGQMRHGHRGAAEIAESVENLFAFAATTQAVPSRHFDLLFDATCGDDRVRAFLLEANREAATSMAERFAEAQRRGFWQARRNSTASILAEMRGVAR
jgi:cobaltochelatase CobN